MSSHGSLSFGTALYIISSFLCMLPWVTGAIMGLTSLLTKTVLTGYTPLLIEDEFLIASTFRRRLYIEPFPEPVSRPLGTTPPPVAPVPAAGDCLAVDDLLKSLLIAFQAGSIVAFANHGVAQTLNISLSGSKAFVMA